MSDPETTFKLAKPFQEAGQEEPQKKEQPSGSTKEISQSFELTKTVNESSTLAATQPTQKRKKSKESANGSRISRGQLMNNTYRH